MLARYIISEFDCEVEVLGIQPAQNEVDSELSSPVHTAVDEIVAVLATFLQASLV
jgi:Ni,Fe-hydrogenase maturation factor